MPLPPFTFMVQHIKLCDLDSEESYSQFLSELKSLPPAANIPVFLGLELSLSIIPFKNESRRDIFDGEVTEVGNVKIKLTTYRGFDWAFHAIFNKFC
jgi:hypothetical protein